MRYLHQKLIQKYQSYNKWHQTKHHNKVHWGVFTVFALLVFSLIFNFADQIYAQSDTQAPTTPTGLTAQAISSTQINLSWTASADNVGVAGYKIYRNGVLLTTQNSPLTTYSDTGLTANTTYIYTVSAYDAAGNESPQSQPLSATTLSSFKPSDLNQDGKTDKLDFDILKSDFKRTDKPPADLNQDGIVDSRDLGILMSEWGR